MDAQRKDQGEEGLRNRVGAHECTAGKQHTTSSNSLPHSVHTAATDRRNTFASLSRRLRTSHSLQYSHASATPCLSHT